MCKCQLSTFNSIFRSTRRHGWPGYAQYFDMTVDKIFERMNVLGAELHRVNLAVSRGGNSNVATPQESRPCSARPEMPVVQGQVVAGEVQAPHVQQLQQPQQPQQQFLGPDAMSNIQVFRCSIVIFFWRGVLAIALLCCWLTTLWLSNVLGTCRLEVANLTTSSWCPSPCPFCTQQLYGWNGPRSQQPPGDEFFGWLFVESSYLDVSENSGTPKSSILIGFSIINHPFWGTPIFGNTHLESPKNTG